MMPQVPRSAAGTMWENAPGMTNANSPTAAGSLGATGHTLPRGAPSAPGELRRAHTHRRHAHIECRSIVPLTPTHLDWQPYTPLRHAQFAHELRNHPDNAWVARLLEGLRHGVRLGYTGPRSPTRARNLPSAFTHPEAIDTEQAKECAAGRIHGPFREPPFPNLHCSGLGAVPKKDGRWRMILHLSAPAGRSINDHISQDDYSLHYTSIDDAIRILLQLGKGALMAKVDLKSAFRMVPVHPADWELLGMHWKEGFYFDTCLPFGLRSAPFLFNEVATAIEWILQNNYDLSALIHYLDDYFLAGPPSSPQCGQHLRCFLHVAALLGALVAMEKVAGPTTTLPFLGLILDSIRQEIRLPPEKLQEILHLLDLWATHKNTTKRELLSLIGKVSFAARAVPAGRLFLRRLIMLSTTVTQLHHHIRLTADARADIEWWQTFLPTWNGTAKFIDPATIAAADMDLFTDAAGHLGCGAYFKGSWFHYTWDARQASYSIQWKELFVIVAAALTWGHLWEGKRIQFHCDNQAIVLAWQSRRAKQPLLMTLLRKLFLTAATGNFHVTLKHLPGHSNAIADAISRRQFTRFFSLSPQADPHPTPTPGMLTTL